jgi:hypothetical protein
MFIQKAFQIISIFSFIGWGVSAAQPLVSVGVKGGVPLTERTSGGDESKPYLFGPSIEFRLPLGFAVEVDALYQRIGNTVRFYGEPGFYSRRRANEWQFPILGKYYFQPSTRRWRPYVGAGYSVRTAWAHIDGQTITADNQALPFGYDYRTPVEVGASFVAGLRYRVGRIAISPEFRYQRWSNDTGLTRKNDVQFLVGISF